MATLSGLNLENNQRVDHPVQGVMSRTGSFPLPVAYQLLTKYGTNSSIIFDPFCGKGTTLLAARMFACPAYGLDIAPEAVACSLAKLADVTVERVCDYVKKLRIRRSCPRSAPASVRVFFHDFTLAQILSIRDQLIRDARSRSEDTRGNAIFALASLLGILHGHASYSLSVSSAHAYSMAPGYVRRFAAMSGLAAPAQDVKACLIEKISRCLKVPLPKAVESDVRRGSALNCSLVFPELVGKVSLVLTSPPYLDAQTYAKDNWLRLWLLGYEYRRVQGEYIETGSVERYKELMTRVFRELRLMMKPGGRLICVAGDVRLRRKRGAVAGEVFPTGRYLAKLCQSKEVGLEVEHYEKHGVASSRRYFHALNGANGHGKRDLVERVFVARKP